MSRLHVEFLFDGIDARCLLAQSMRGRGKPLLSQAIFHAERLGLGSPTGDRPLCRERDDVIPVRALIEDGAFAESRIKLLEPRSPFGSAEIHDQHAFRR